ncbi:MAG TPA: hypothetical protein VH915_03460 [Pedococcus sp.]
MPAVHRLRHQGHLLEVALDHTDGLTRADLRLGGVAVASRTTRWGDCVFDLGEVAPLRDALGEAGAAARVRASTGWTGRGPGAVSLLLPALGGRRTAVPFEPPQGTRAHRRWAWERRHPRLHAARHVAVAAAQVIAGVVGLGLLLAMLPRIPWPDLPAIPWPDLDLPRIPWPDLPAIPWPDLPDVTVPAWLRAVLESRRYWWPVLVAIAVAVLEVRRRQRHRALEDASPDAQEAEDQEPDGQEGGPRWRAPSTPSDTSSAGSSSSTRP